MFSIQNMSHLSYVGLILGGSAVMLLYSLFAFRSMPFVSSLINQNHEHLSSDSVQTSPSTLNFIKRNRLRWLRLQDVYQSINTTALSTMPRNSTHKFIIYKCTSFCGGLGDRFRGILTCFILALVSDRRFMIDITHPLDIKNYLLPNLYNWTLDTTKFNSNSPRKTISAIDMDPSLKNEIQTTNFIETWDKHDIIDIYTNIDFVSDIFHNSAIRKNEIMKMFLENLSIERLTMHNLFPLLFEILFQPSLEVMNELEPILHMFDDGYTLTCIHIRIGKNPSNPGDYQIEHRDSALEDLIKFLNQAKLHNRHNTRIFIASDSEAVLKRMVEQYPNQTITIPGPILHVDHPAHGIDLIRGFVKVLIEFYLMGECHTSILTASGFSGLANRRRVEPYQNLFKYDGLNRRIERCQDVYEYERGQQPITVLSYCRVIFNCSTYTL